MALDRSRHWADLCFRLGGGGLIIYAVKTFSYENLL